MFRKILILIMFLSISSLSFAKDKPKELNIISSINLYGVTFTHGVPPWLNKITDPKDILKASKFYKDQNGPSFIWEAIPGDQTFETWKTIYAIKALASQKNVTLTVWENQTIPFYKKTCEYPEIKYLIMGMDASLVQIVCPKVINFTEHGYNEAVGEVSIFAFMKIHMDQGTVYIAHYTEWRGAAFDFNDRENWPVTEEELNRGILNLKKAKAFTKEKQVSFGIE